MTADLALVRNALKDLVRPKKVAAALVLVAAPALLALAWRAGDRHRFDASVAYNALSAGLVFGFALVILSVVFGTGVISQEIEQKTIVYLLTRPLPRWRILFAKFAAAFLATTVTVWLATIALAVVCFGFDGVGHSRLGRDMLILPVGALAYSALFLLLATFINRALVVGLVFAFGWESWVPNMPGSFQRISLMTYLRVLAPHPKPEAETLDISQVFSLLNPETISQRVAWEVLACVTAAALLLATIVFTSREYAPRDDAA